MGSYVTFPAAPKSSGGLLTRPDNGAPRSPAILILPPIAGVNPYISSVADQLAAEGFTSLALDYFVRRGGVPDLSDRGKAIAAVASLSDSQMLSDIEAATAYLRAQPFVDSRRIAVLGFCVGGTYAILSGTIPDAFRCAVAFYGVLEYPELSETKPISPIDAAPGISCPLLGHFGENDQLVPLDQVLKLKEKLRDHRSEIYTYSGAGHAFHEGFRPDVYRPVAAEEAWRRTLTYFRWYCTPE